jgi:hypothetical protein
MKTLVPVLGALAMISVAIPRATADGKFDRTLAVSGPVDLDVTTDSGGIVVTTGSPGAVHVHAILKAQHGWFGYTGDEAHIRELERNPPVEQTGNRLRIGYVHDRYLLRGISMRFEIETPPDTRLRARADSGGIRVEGIRGTADCATDSGGIDIRNIGSDVHATADSGGIHINRVAGSVVARADSGGIEASDIAGGIDVATDSGGIRLSQTKPGRIQAKADSGGVQATLVRDAGYEVDVETDSGRISVPELMVRGSLSRHHVEGKLRGGGPLVSVRVGSGTVSID